jgi:hypothetical protein
MRLLKIIPIMFFVTLTLQACGGSSSGGGAGAGAGTPVYYVDSNAVDDTGDGLTPATAKQTINAAIQQTVINAVSPASVFVNTGIYTVDSAPGTDTHVVVVEGVSLFGGYNADFSVRDPLMFPSTIQDTSTAMIGGFTLIPNRALEAGTGITAATIIDGFTFNGTSSATDFGAGAAIINGADPTLQNNIFNGGVATINSGLWVRDTGTSPLVDGNTMNGGTGGESYGMLIQMGATPTVQD